MTSNNELTGFEVAVIGMAGRFPAARNLDEFWENLKNGIECTSFFTDEELKETVVDPQLLEYPNYVKTKGILEDIEYFDAEFFDYTPREAEIMDPQVRIFHQCAWEALEDSGYDAESYDGLIGFYAGASSGLYWQALAVLGGKTREIGEFIAGLLMDKDYLTLRLAYKLNLKGPVFLVQTACSTSLVAIHVACQAMLNGECDMALAGGVTVSLPNKSGYLYQPGNIFPEDGHCRAFDARGEGTIGGDGAGIVVLKLLEDALDDGDNIYAVIKGSAINNDGVRKVGFTAPSVEGQAEVIKIAHRVAHVEPETISYIETHGTGTSLGDPVEIEGLKLAFNTTKKGFCPIGAVKTNVGHLDAAAGVAGFIKTVLSLNHRLIPPTLHFESPNPKIDFENSPFYVNHKLLPWERNGHPLRAGVSSFGIGGTNAHVVLEEAPQAETPSQSRQWQLLLLSAKTQNALERQTQKLLEFLKQNPAINPADAAYTLQVGRRAFPHRRMVVGSDLDSAVDALSSGEPGKHPTFHLEDDEISPVFMFSGLGAQYVNMGRGLYETEPVFRQEMDRCFDLLKPISQHNFKDILYPASPRGESGVDIGRIEISQVAVFIFQYALTKLLMHWGVKPHAMIGYSFGEYTAACVSGVFSLEDALKLIVYRGKLIHREPGGTMLSVPMTAGKLAPLVPRDLSLAIDNGPSCIVAGASADVDAFEKYLREKRHLCMKLPNPHALHSQMMEPILLDFEAYVASLTLNEPQIPYISNVTGTWVNDKDAVNPAYWARHLRETVRFAGGIDELKNVTNPLFIEIGPGRDLATLLIRHREDDSQSPAFNTVRQQQQDIPDDRYLLSKIGHLWMHGVKIDWSRFYEAEKRLRIPLPTYAFENRRYWIDGNPFNLAESQLAPVQEKEKEPKELFYLPSWKPALMPVEPAKPAASAQGACWMMFIDGSGLAVKLAQQLEQEGNQVFRVKPGTGFQKVDDFTYTIDPGADEDYQRLLADIETNGRFAASIVHLWGIDGIDQAGNGGWSGRDLDFEAVHRAQELGLYSLVRLAGGIGKPEADQQAQTPRRQIKVVTNNMQRLPGDEGLYPEKSPVLAAINMIPRQYPDISCCSIDISLPPEGTPTEERLIQQLLVELKRDIYRPVIAYRGYERLEQDLEPVRLPGTNGGNLQHRLKENGLYLFIQGLEGIGFEIARYLLRLPPRPSLAFIQDIGSAAAETDGQPNDTVLADTRVPLDLSEEIGFMDDTATTIDKQLGIKGTETYPGLEDKIDELCSLYILDYFKQNSVRIEPGQSYGIDQLKKTVGILPKHYNLLDFFIRVLAEDKFIQASEDSITFLENDRKYETSNILKQEIAGNYPQFIGSLNILEHCAAHYTPALKGEIDALSVLFPGGKLIGTMEEYRDPVMFSYEQVYILLFQELLEKVFDTDRSNQEKTFRILEIGSGNGLLTQVIAPGLKGKNVEYHFTDIGNFFVVNARRKFSGPDFSFMKFGVFDITKDPLEQGYEKHGFDMIVGLNVVHATPSIEVSLATIKSLLAPNGILALVEGTNPRRSLNMIDGLTEGWWYFEDTHIRPHLPLLSLDTWEEVFKDAGFQNISSYPRDEAKRLTTDRGLIIGQQQKEIHVEPDTRRRGKITRNFKLLEKTGAHLRLVHTDITDLEAMRQTLSQLQEERGPVCGLFHFIDARTDAHDNGHNNNNGDGSPSMVAGQLSAAIKNLLVLDQLFKDKPLDPFVFCSSSNSAAAGNNGMGGSAAEIFMNAFSQYKLHNDHRFNVSLNWDPGVETDICGVVETLLDPTFTFNRLDVSSVEPGGRTSAAEPAAIAGEPRTEAGERHQRPELSSDYVPPAGELEQTMVTIWREFLGIDRVGVYDDFLELGADSLVFVTIASRIHRALNVNVPIPEFFSRLNIKGVADYIIEAQTEEHAAIEPVEKKEYYAMSSVQQRLYFLQQMDKESNTYNIPFVLIWAGEMDEDRFEDAFKRLILRHESLRTSFEMTHGDPIQKIHDRVNFEIEYYDATGASSHREIENRIKSCIRPFDLSQAPLLRVGLIKETEDKRYLVLDMHHIISDGVSIGLFVHEFMAFYRGQDLPAPRIMYKDFSERQNSPEVKELMNRQESYWLTEFENEIPVLNLPWDQSRPPIQRFEGAIVNFDIEENHVAALKTFARDEGATLFMLLLGVYNVFLSKLSGQEDIVVGTPTAGRRHSDLENIIGMFVNTLALRNYPHGEKTFKQFLGEIKTRTLQAFDNQDYQYEDLVEKVEVNRDVSRNPLFDAMFVLQNFNIPEVVFEGMSLKPYPFEQGISRFDLSLLGSELEGPLTFTVEYSTNLFNPATIERFINYFRKIIAIVTRDPEIKIADIEIITEEEKNRLLYDFNDTETLYPREKTIDRLFEEQVDKTPDSIAAVFEGHAISYKDLNTRANHLALTLSDKRIQKDMVVGLMVRRSLEMIIGILGILKTGAAYLPMDPGFPAERIEYMLKDSAAGLLVSQQDVLENMSRECHTGDTLDLDPVVQIISPGSPASAAAGNTVKPSHDPGDLAYVIYTSGSTGKPKGVTINHRNVNNFIHGITARIQFPPGEAILALTTLSFDIFVLETLLPLVNGLKIVIATEDQQLNPRLLADNIIKEHVSMLQMTPSTLQLLLDSDAGFGFLEAANVLMVGGEGFPQSLFQRLKAEYNGNIYNMYGPTETTVWSAVRDLTQAEKIDIGTPIANTRIDIIDRYNKLLPIGAVGELCIGGDGLSRGYLNRPELSAEKFSRDGQRFGRDEQRGILYRTGDLARWLPDGNIQCLGRIDNQVKIRGFRIELGDIESQVLTYGDIDEAVVVAKTDAAGEKNLCAYLVAAHEIDISLLREFLSGKLPDYMIPSYFVSLERIPLTPNGKIDRKALPAPDSVLAVEAYVPPQDHIEEELADIWSEILGTEKTKISTAINFFQLGGHSLRATIMTAKIQKALNVDVPLTQIFKSPTIKRLAHYIKGLATSEYVSLRPVEKSDYYPLSSAQRRLYVLKDLDEQGTAYNLSSLLTLEGDVDTSRLEDTFRKLFHRHESLRTSFHMMADEPMQRIHETGDLQFAIEYFDIPEQERTPAIKNFIRPFEFSDPPLLRVGLIKEEEKKHLLIVDMHHIVSDGVSISIITREFMQLYDGEILPDIDIHYKDFAAWQNSEEVSESIRKQKTYWLKEFADDVPALNLPYDFPRPAVKSFEGRILNFELDKETTRGLKAFALAEGNTLFMVLLSAFNVLMQKLSGQQDIPIGTPIAGRGHADLEHIVGMFVNTLVLRNFPQGEKSFKDFSQEVKARTLEAFENQDYLYEDLVDGLNLLRDTARNPLFDAMFILQNMDWPEISIPGLTLKPYDYDPGISRFDLTLMCFEIQEKLSCTFSYSTRLFKPATIERFVDYFKKIISFIIENPRIEISAMEILSQQEKKSLLYDFNDTASDYPADKTIHRLFTEQAARTPGNIAVYGQSALHPADNPVNTSLTYKQLDTVSGRLSALLQEKGAGPGSFTAVMMEPCPEMMAAIFAVLKAGSCYVPIDPQNPGERIDYILKDSETRLLITHAHLAGQAPENIEIINIDNRDLYKPSNQKALPGIDGEPGDPVYMIYTSGTTGKPKGVVLKHRNLVNYVNWFATAADLTNEDRAVLNSSFSFDLGYTSIYPSLLSGAQLHIQPKDFYMIPAKLLDYIRSQRISYIKMAPSFFAAIIADPAFSSEAFASLRLLVLGGEAINTGDVEKVHRMCPHLRVINHYGPTEVTIGCIARFIDFDYLEEYKARPTIGRPIFNTKAYILDKYSQLSPVGVPGELCLSGASVAKGYYKRQELTSEKFTPNVFADVSVEGKEESATHDRIYHTGDLARWGPDGYIEFLGRIDQQIKIRGFRIELGEIENQLLDHEDVDEAVVVARPDEQGDKYLCGYIVSQKEPTRMELLKFLAAKLPDYMIPAHIVSLEKIPLTPNGKVDRKSLPAPDIDAGDLYTPPSNENEKRLVEIWSDVLGIENDKISIDANFFAIGGHSLRATILTAKIHRELNIDLPLAQVFKSPTVKGLSDYMKELAPSQYTSLEPAEEKEYYPLSSAQRRLYVLKDLDDRGISYNVPVMLTLEGDVHKNRFEDTFSKLVKRHESLRTSFHMVADEPMQRVHDPHAVDIEIEYYDRPEVDEASMIKDFVRPFDFLEPPLLRVGLVKEASQKYLLMVDKHHIISDGVSTSLMIREFMQFYNGESLADIPIHYRDFAAWQNSPQARESLKQQETYWLDRFEGEIPVLNLPCDYPRPLIQEFEGSVLNFQMDKEIVQALKEHALAMGATFFMVLLSAYNVFLHKLGNQQDIAVGTPIAGRGHADLEHIVGMFVNTLVLRNFPGGGKSFNQFLQEVKAHTVEAFDNQDYPYEDLVEAVDVVRDTGRNPLFDTMFILQNMDVPQMEIPGLALKPLDYDTPISRFDLTLQCFESEEKLLCSFEYSTKLFKKATIERFVNYFRRVMSAVSANPAIKISDIEIISEEEKNRLLYEFNDTAADYPKEKTMHRLFQEQVEKTPGHIAVVFEDQHLSYSALNQQSNKLARGLRQKGAGPDMMIGIMAKRSLEMMTGIMAIIKAGSAYLPIDPDYPPERKSYILKDSNARLLLFKTECENILAGVSLLIDLDDPASYEGGGENLEIINKPGDLAYGIYTSGSTGRPKGVVIQHYSLINRLNWMQKQYRMNDRDIILHKTPFTFDVSLWEIFWWSLVGAKVCLLVPGGEKEPGTMVDAIQRHGTTIMHFVPSMLKVFLEFLKENHRAKDLESLRLVVASGEALTVSMVTLFNDVLNQPNGTRLTNLYGPTEATVDVSYFDCPPGATLEKVPIGKPIDNTNLLVLDDYLKVQPVGISGKLYIAGDGLARGYLNRPELTAEKFGMFFNKNRLYHTGDLARWLPDGNIDFLGRIDHQVKIRGFRIELGEIESQLRKYDAVNEAVVVDKTDAAGDKYLCAYLAPVKEFDIPHLREFLSQSLADYMIPGHFVTLEHIPLTSSGKVDRKALPDPGVTAGKQDRIPPRDRLEENLAQTWAEVLAIDKEAIGIEDNFFDLGGHSLKASVLIQKLHRRLDVKLSLADLFKTPKLKTLANRIKGAEQDKYAAIQPVETKEYYPLSPAQNRMFILHQMLPNDTTYNIPQVAPLDYEESRDRERLENSLKQLIDRHESLRTSFELVAGEPVQRIHRQVEFEIEYFDTSSRESFIRPFDLSKPPLFRVGLIKEQEEKYFLAVDMHHVISDGVSNEVLTRDFNELYEGRSLEKLRIQYKDYAQWLHRPEVKETLDRQEKYWLDQFREEIPVLNLPIDYPRPAVQSFEGDVLDFEIPSQPTRLLEEIASNQGATLNMVLLAVMNILLSKLSGQQEIIIGSPVAGRRHADLEKIIGMFVNALALWNYPEGQKTFSQFLMEVKGKTLSAFENQEYPFEDLVTKLDLDRDAARTPLFDVMFVLQTFAGEDFPVPDGVQYRFQNNPAKFDLTVVANKTETEKLLVSIQYCTRLFKKETIERFVNYLRKIIASVVHDPGVTLAQIEIISEEEKKVILQDFNDTSAPCPQNKTAHQLIEDQVKKYPDYIAVKALAGKDDGELDSSITYRQLNEKANQLARFLRKRGVGADSIVGLLADPSTHFITAIMGIVKAGGAYLPIDPAAPAERARYITDDSAISILLSDSTIDGEFSFDGEWYTLDNPELYKGSTRNPGSHSRSQNLAYVIYTSGSTGRPKGVAVEHSQLINLLYHMYNGYERACDVNDRFLSGTNIMFDVSVWEYFQALAFGMQLVLMPRSERHDVFSLAEIIHRKEITLTYIPPALLKEVCDLLEKQPGRLRMNKMMVGVEPIRDEVLEGYMRLNPNMCILICYGPTEAAVISTSKRYISHKPRGEFVPIGCAVNNNQVVLLDAADHIVPVGIPGELCISGDNVSRGYLNNPQMTAEKFAPHPYYNVKCMYRTGDMAYWRENGDIQFIGRIDHQVKVRGYRIELGEIQQCLIKHPDVQEAVVLVKGEQAADRYICAYLVARDPARGADDEELREHLSRKLPDYMIPSCFVAIDGIPLTPNGKVDRKALPEPVLSAEENVLGARDETETRLVAIWADVLGMNARSIGIDANFFRLGGHSLKATILISKIHKEMDIKIPLVEIFTNPTIRELARCIKGLSQETYKAIEAVEKKDYYTASSGQRRLYVLQQMEPENTAYNMPLVIPLAQDADLKKLEATFLLLIDRHESFRTSFSLVNGQPVQRIHDRAGFKIEAPADAPDLKALTNNFVRAFDLSRAPLVRAGLIQTADSPPLLMVDMHHIISDGVSLDILMREFTRLYLGQDLPVLRIQYKDFAQWQTGESQGGAVKQQESFWLKTFEGEIPQLDLPIDYPRPAVQSFDGDIVDFQMSAADTAALKALALESDITLYMLLLAIFNILLSKLSGQEDIIIGTTMAGRRHPHLENIIGMFVNTLALRNAPNAEKSIHQFLQDVKDNTLQAFENQEYPFEDLVEKVDVERDIGRNPLFDAMFSMQNIFDEDDIPDAGIAAEESLTTSQNQYQYEDRTAKFDLTFTVGESGGKLLLGFKYCTRLFKRESIQRFRSYFQKITAALLRDRRMKLKQIEIASEEEKQMILHDFNDTDAEYPRDKTIHQLFEEQVAKTPDHTALSGRISGKKVSVSYRELDQQSNRLAALLKEKGIQPDQIVCIMLERSVEMMTGIFAILKSGGAYLPIDPAYPPERIAYMLADSSANILLRAGGPEKTGEQSDIMETHGPRETIFIDNLDFSGLSSPEKKSLPASASPSSLAYVIYTSGSTGKPKGVAVQHGSVINRLNWMQRYCPLEESDVILQKTTVTFDVSVWELFWWSFYGAGLCLLEPGGEKDPAAIIEAVSHNQVTTMHFVPSMLGTFLAHLEASGESGKLVSLKRVFASGEALKLEHYRQFHRLLTGTLGTRLINLYGPTEATVDVTYFDCAAASEMDFIPIGKPIDNTRLFILDGAHKLQPVGIPGELCISGAGLARGYLNQPALTAEKFDRDLKAAAPHSPLYRTGDLARWLPDGNIEFLGRIDHQVKIRGFRIELGEIEAGLIQSPVVREAAVTASQDQTGDNRLAAYVVPDETRAYTVRKFLGLENSGLLDKHSYYDLPNGMPMFYLNRNETDFMYREIFQERNYLKHGITLTPGSCILDIGANIGMFSLFVHRVCQDARIYSFEPLPPVFELLQLNTSLYGDNFTVFQAGVSSEAGEREFTYYPNVSILSGAFADTGEEKETLKAFIKEESQEDAGGQVSEEHLEELLDERLNCIRYKCSLKTVSQIIRENQIETIDLLKIDVEKAELEVLNGISPEDWPKIRQLVIEVHHSEEMLKQIKELLETHGYTVAVEQDPLLEKSGLCNLYARLSSLEQEISAGEPWQQEPGTWYSPGRFTGHLEENLKSQLPAYMVPSFFVLLEHMPLTASGKVNRKALPLPRLRLGRTVTPPSSETETALAEIWSEVLDINKESISIDASFFDIGGHSLKATIMAARVQERLNLLLPLAEIFKTPNIKQLAQYLEETDPAHPQADDANLVLLRRGTDKTGHIFLIHDGSGEVEGYIEFCQLSTLPFNYWGIRADRLRNLAPHHCTIEEIARQYIEKIKKIQAHGPYSIAGWSLGGTIAFEMACQLEQAGENISFLGLFDSPGPNEEEKAAVSERVLPFNPESELAWLLEYPLPGQLKEKLKKTADIHELWPVIAGHLEENMEENMGDNNTGIQWVKSLIPDQLAGIIPNYDRLGIEELIYYSNLNRTLTRARALYTPAKKIHTPLHYLKASESPAILRDRWNDYCLEALKSYEISGNHLTLFKENSVKNNVKIFEFIVKLCHNMA